MFTFLIIVITLIALVMTFLILVQAGRGGGLAGIAAGGTQQILGSRQAPDVLEKATWILAAVFIVLCILTNFTIDTGEQQENILRQGTEQQEQQPLAPLPEAPAPETTPAPEGEQPQQP